MVTDRPIRHRGGPDASSLFPGGSGSSRVVASPEPGSREEPARRTRRAVWGARRAVLLGGAHDADPMRGAGGTPGRARLGVRMREAMGCGHGPGAADSSSLFPLASPTNDSVAEHREAEGLRRAFPRLPRPPRAGSRPSRLVRATLSAGASPGPASRSSAGAVCLRRRAQRLQSPSPARRPQRSRCGASRPAPCAPGASGRMGRPAPSRFSAWAR